MDMALVMSIHIKFDLPVAAASTSLQPPSAVIFWTNFEAAKRASGNSGYAHLSYLIYVSLIYCRISLASLLSSVGTSMAHGLYNKS